MKRVNYFPYIILLVCLLFIMSIPQKTIHKIRNFAVASVAPSWSGFNSIRKCFFKTPIATIGNKDINPTDDTFEKLKLENALLKNQTDGFYEWLIFEQRIQEQVEKYTSLSKEEHKDIYWNDFFRRRAEELKEILKIELQALPARVVFRDPNSWSSSIWINIGEKHNENLNKLIISKNSPVVLGQNLIGLVEYVGYKYSKVRLITDSSLIPSVRAVRGKTQDKAILSMIESLKNHIYDREDLFSSDKEKQSFIQNLKILNNRLRQENIDKYLAKGEISGASQPLWRSRGVILKGIGFNYDYPDEEGPARELTSGKIITKELNSIKQEVLLKKGDLLITTGLDGIFPAGLNVGIVTKVNDLKEGDYAYSIEAKPVQSNINDLDMVFVMPAIDLNINESVANY